ncbi:hypothetical protein OQA88_4124 [Cercophora sp. LCS_1]
MDSMMFSAYGYGPLPPSAMAEIEKKMAVALRNSNLQKMLELEKKHKIERLHSAPASPPPPAPPVEHQELSLQVRRADSLSQQQNYLMLKAVRRSVVLPSLSIDIPQPPTTDASERPQCAELGSVAENINQDNAGNPAVASVEPLHKQVKFLAPEGDDEMSDQSSICQSPSWEGYGQRKKEKKKEAERRRKEKEQAEKEARAAKRRPATRLSKSPPPVASSRASQSSGLTNAERSMSDPLLVSQHLRPEHQYQDRADHIGRAISADDLQNLWQHQPAVAEVLSDPTPTIDTRQFVGGVKLDREREAVLQRHLSGHGQQQSPTFPPHLMPENQPATQISSHPSRADGSIPGAHPLPVHAPTSRQESRPTRELFPPSASRTPMLRQISAPVQQTRNQGFLQGAAKIFRGKDGKAQGDGELERGRNRGSYVQHYREQSTERSIAEAAYEQLVNSGNIFSSSTRSSSRNTQHRRSSFTQEARSVAMKLAGIKPTPSTKDDSRTSTQSDYFNYLEHTSSSSGHGASTPSDTRSVSARNQDGDKPRHAEGYVYVSAAALRDVSQSHERPPTAQSFVSSNNPSVAGSSSSSQSSKKNRSLRDAAKAALSMSRGPLPQSNTSQTRQTLLAPTYPTFRGRMESQASVSGPQGAVPSPDSLGPPLMPAPATHCPTDQTRTSSSGPLTSASMPSTIKPSEVGSQNGSRASEGSSSSSAYEDGSPLPSPVTTPDTSRPQSSKDLPYIVGELTKGTVDKPLTQDDEETLRQPSDGSSTSTTPRLVKSESQENAEMTDEDRWSRTALPIDIDTDAQSFTASFSNLDHLDNIDKTLANAEAHPQPTPETQRKPLPAAVLSSTISVLSPKEETRANGATDRRDIAVPDVPLITPPPRSKRRKMTLDRQPSLPDASLPEGRDKRSTHEIAGAETTAQPSFADTGLLRGVNTVEASDPRERTTVENTADAERVWDPEKQIARREKGRRKQYHENTMLQQPQTSPKFEMTSSGGPDISPEHRNHATPANEGMPANPLFHQFFRVNRITTYDVSCLYRRGQVSSLACIPHVPKDSIARVPIGSQIIRAVTINSIGTTVSTVVGSIKSIAQPFNVPFCWRHTRVHPQTTNAVNLGPCTFGGSVDHSLGGAIGPPKAHATTSWDVGPTAHHRTRGPHGSYREDVCRMLQLQVLPRHAIQAI